MQDPERVKQAVGRKVAEYRRAAGLTQFALANEIGDVSPQYVGLVEQGRQNLTIETLVKVANALHVDVAALFEEPASMERPQPGRPRRDVSDP